MMINKLIKKPFEFAGFMAAALMVSGCGVIGEFYYSDDNIKIPAQFTYKWLEQPRSHIQMMTKTQADDVRKGFADGLTKRGCSNVQDGDADYLIAIHYSPKSDMSPVDVIDSYGIPIKRNGLSDENNLLTEGVDGGELVIDMIDSESREIVWRGGTRGQANRFRMNKSAEEIAETVPNNDCLNIQCVNIRGLY